MIAADDSPATRGPRSADAASDPLTHVELTWMEKRQEDWIRFGRQAREQILDRRRRLVSFPPGSTFGLVRWAANDFGTILSNIAIARAVGRAEAFQTLPSVRPGADVLLTVDGWPKVERVLQAIDAVEDRGIDPADVAPDYWRHVHNRLAAGLEPRTYTAARHLAFRLRRSVAP